MFVLGATRQTLVRGDGEMVKSMGVVERFRNKFMERESEDSGAREREGGGIQRKRKDKFPQSCIQPLET